MTVTNVNLIQEEIKRRLNSGNACYYAVTSADVGLHIKCP
jgi:hypothetical protein